MLRNTSFILPFSFITLYGSGFVITQFGLQYASPMAFLFYRFMITMFILYAISWYLKESLPQSFKEFFHILIAGALTVGTFSIGVYISISLGVNASLSALIIALQPLLVTFVALLLLKEHISIFAWVGLLIGLIGVAFVIGVNEQNLELKWGIFYSVIGLLGLSLGNIYQKKFCSKMKLFSGGAIQNLASFVLVFPFFYFEQSYIQWNASFLASLFGMIFLVSIGALSLLYMMIEKGEVSKVASVFYLIPVSAAFFGMLILGSPIGWEVILGVVFILFSMVLIHQNKFT
jgi:drug/metabolite transporter (DMT)-like permease